MDIINFFKIVEVLAEDFPDWYQHRIEDDVNLTIKFWNKKRLPVVFSENALDSTSKKRKAEEIVGGSVKKKSKISENCKDIHQNEDFDKDNDNDDSEDNIESERSASYIPYRAQ